jgi:hypothetical protein
METYISPLFVRIDFHYFLKLQEQKQKTRLKLCQSEVEFDEPRTMKLISSDNYFHHRKW